MSENERMAGMLHYGGGPGAVVSLYRGSIEPRVKDMAGREVNYDGHKGVLLSGMDADNGSMMVNVARYNSLSQVDVVVGETVQSGDKLYYHHLKRSFEKVYDAGVPTVAVAMSSPVVDCHWDNQLVARVVLETTAARFDLDNSEEGDE